MTKRWYYQMLLEEFGPVTAEQLAVLIEEGTVGDTDLIRAEGSDQWFEASQWTADSSVEEATANSGSGEFEEISDLSELSFEFENSGAGTRTRTAPEISQPTPLVAETLPVEEEVEPAIYFYQSFGQTLGPLPLSSLVSLAEAGAISEIDQVRVGESSVWKPASTIQELSIAFMTSDRTLDQAPQLSLATQKRLGEQATAAALAPEKPSSTEIEVQNPGVGREASTSEISPSESASDSKAEIDTPARKSSGKGKATRKEAAKKREDALLENIFEDVFSEETPPARPSMAASAAMMSAAPASPAVPQVSSVAPSTPIPPTPAYMSNSAASMSRPTLAPMAKSRSSSSSSSVNLMPLLKFGGIGILVLAVLYGGYTLFSRKAGPPIDFYVTKLKLAADDLKKLGKKPSEVQWLSFCSKKTEFTLYQNKILESNATGESVDKCKLAITMLLRTTSTRFKEKDDVKKASEDFLKAVENL